MEINKPTPAEHGWYKIQAFVYLPEGKRIPGYEDLAMGILSAGGEDGFKYIDGLVVRRPDPLDEFDRDKYLDLSRSKVVPWAVFGLLSLATVLLVVWAYVWPVS